MCGRRSLACRNAERRWAFQRVWLAAFFRLKPITCALGAFSYELTGAYDASGRQAMPVRLWRYIWNCRKELWFPARACCFRPPRKLPLVIQKLEEMSKFCFCVGQRPNQLIVQNSKTPNTLWFPLEETQHVMVWIGRKTTNCGMHSDTNKEAQEQGRTSLPYFSS